MYIYGLVHENVPLSVTFALKFRIHLIFKNLPLLVRIIISLTINNGRKITVTGKSMLKVNHFSVSLL